jgi:hypothetical protein
MITEIEDYIRRGIVRHYKSKVDADGEDADFYNVTTNLDELVRNWTSMVETGADINERMKYMIETVNYAELYTGEKIRELEGYEVESPQNVVAPIVS